MIDKKLLSMLNELGESNDSPPFNKHERVLLIDGLNLFFRNFSTMNMVNSQGIHIGGLGGFLRSLGGLIRQFDPTSVYVIFDGPGSTANRKNIISEYKGGRNTSRVTNFDIFDSYDEEHDAKIDQIVRLMQYLKFLPVKTMILPKVEADDLIAVMSKKLEDDHKSNIFIVSSDKDFLQLATNKTIIYRPMERVCYNSAKVMETHKVLSENFILYKTLLGDSSDNIPGIKGLGVKKIFSKFPELQTRSLTLQDIYDVSAEKFKDHLIYARVIQDFNKLEKSYKIMDLSNPMVDAKGYEYCYDKIGEDLPPLNSQYFRVLYEEDQIGKIIPNLDYWLKDVFSGLM